VSVCVCRCVCTGGDDHERGPEGSIADLVPPLQALISIVYSVPKQKRIGGGQRERVTKALISIMYLVHPIAGKGFDRRPPPPLQTLKPS
jgi:hypothetical protein